MTRHRHTRPAGAVLAALAAVVLLPTAAAAAPAPCDDHLVTHRPDGTTGDATAVTLTAQALDRGSDGWSMVGWQVAPTTDLRVVQVVTGGTISELPPTTTLAEGDVAELRFCGTSAVAASDAVGPASDGTTPEGAIGVAAGVVTRQLAAARAGTAGTGGTPPTALGLLGATVGAAVGSVVLLLSRGSRHDDEVIR